jgi:hypothetical protein
VQKNEEEDNFVLRLLEKHVPDYHQKQHMKTQDDLGSSSQIESLNISDLDKDPSLDMAHLRVKPRSMKTKLTQDEVRERRRALVE